MMLRRALAFVVVSSSVAIAACGGAHPAKAPAPPGPSTTGPVATAPTAPLASTTPAPPALPAQTAADHHRRFMGGCAKKAVNSPDYCECAWGEFRKAFTDDEIDTGLMPAVKLDKLKSQVAGACASKIPESTVKEGFSNGCVGSNSDMKPYCDCTYTEFRKRFSAAELGDDATVTTERFIAAQTPVVKACGNKMPESVSKDAFMKGCAKDPSTDKFCGCAWKELRKQASPAEIESGTFDQKIVFAQVEKSCGKLRPAKP